MYKLLNERFSKKCGRLTDFLTYLLTELLTDKVIHRGTHKEEIIFIVAYPVVRSHGSLSASLSRVKMIQNRARVQKLRISAT